MSKVQDHITGETFELLRCQNCGLVFVEPQPAPADLHRYYPRTHQRSEPAVYERMDARPRVGLLEHWLGGRPGRALDVGCGKGLLLSSLRKRGWDVVGTELSEASARYARSLGLTVHSLPVEAAPLKPSSFDVVTLFHVLEHLINPCRSLAHIHGLLRPDGLLVVEVPNAGSWYARAFGTDWFHLDVPRHLFHFTRPSLRMLLQRTGFEVVREETRNLQYDAFGAVQSLLNKFLERKNLLNNFNTGEVTLAELRAAPDRYRALGSLALSQMVLMVGFPLFALAEVLLSPWVDGGTLRFVARPAGSPDPALASPGLPRSPDKS